MAAVLQWLATGVDPVDAAAKPRRPKAQQQGLQGGPSSPQGLEQELAPHGLGGLQGGSGSGLGSGLGPAEVPAGPPQPMWCELLLKPLGRMGPGGCAPRGKPLFRIMGTAAEVPDIMAAAAALAE